MVLSFAQCCCYMYMYTILCNIYGSFIKTYMYTCIFLQSFNNIAHFQSSRQSIFLEASFLSLLRNIVSPEVSKCKGVCNCLTDDTGVWLVTRIATPCSIRWSLVYMSAECNFAVGKRYKNMSGSSGFQLVVMSVRNSAYCWIQCTIIEETQSPWTISKLY